MDIQILKAREEDEYYFEEGCYILEMANTEHDPALSIARARVLPGDTTRLHSLQGLVERYLILQGCGMIELAGERSEVRVGDVVIIPPECPQKITNTGETDLVFLAIFTPRFQPSCYQNLEACGG